jgi:DNA-directed RNA polymerase subunit omega
VIKPRLDKLLEQTDSHYACVLVAAKRARQINAYYHNLGEGTFDEYPPPMVETGSKNYLKISLEEVARSWPARGSTRSWSTTSRGPASGSMPRRTR